MDQEPHTPTSDLLSSVADNSGRTTVEERKDFIMDLPPSEDPLPIPPANNSKGSYFKERTTTCLPDVSLATTILGLKGNNWIILAADSRVTEVAFGSVKRDDQMKLFWLADNVFATGTGCLGVVKTILEDTMNGCKMHAPTSMREVAETVAYLANKKNKEGSDRGFINKFIVGGRLSEVDDVPALFLITGTRAQHRFALRGEERVVNRVVYEAEETDEAIGGSGMEHVRSFLAGEYEIERLNQLKETGDILEILHFVARAMRVARRSDFCTDGRLNTAYILGLGVHEFFSTMPVDIEDPSSLYGNWAPGQFTPLGYETRGVV